MTDKQNLKEAVRILKMIKKDAELALSGKWDRSDDGFEAQEILIDKFLKSLEKKEEGPLKQITMQL